MREDESKTTLGFWIYLMTDCILFASLFAAFLVLRSNDYIGPNGEELFRLPFVLIETLILLVSSFSCGLAILSARQGKQQNVIPALALTFLLGIIFLSLEVTEFRSLAAEGHSWRASGFLSAFFTLVGTHGLHIATGLLWLLVLTIQISKKGLTRVTVRRLTLFSMFWHFLDVVWIFIFTIVYLMGVIIQ